MISKYFSLNYWFPDKFWLSIFLKNNCVMHVKVSKFSVGTNAAGGIGELKWTAVDGHKVGYLTVDSIVAVHSRKISWLFG